MGGSLSVQTDLIAIPPTATNIVAIAAGRHHILALRADGIVVAWGDDSFGQSSCQHMITASGLRRAVARALLCRDRPCRFSKYRTNRSGGESDNLLLNTAVGGMPPSPLAVADEFGNISGASRAFCLSPMPGQRLRRETVRGFKFCWNGDRHDYADGDGHPSRDGPATAQLAAGERGVECGFTASAVGSLHGITNGGGMEWI